MTTPFPPNHPFASLVPSSTADSIYYADLFTINERNWMIQGYGKTDAARIATNKTDAAMIGTDSIAIVRQGEALFARYDLGAYNPAKPELSALHPLHAIAYCLNPDQTQKAFSAGAKPLDIVEADSELLSAFCSIYPYPASLAPHFFPAQIDWLRNPHRMMQRFVQITAGTVGTKFLVMPHMPTVKDKAALYANYVL